MCSFLKKYKNTVVLKNFVFLKKLKSFLKVRKKKKYININFVKNEKFLPSIYSYQNNFIFFNMFLKKFISINIFLLFYKNLFNNLLLKFSFFSIKLFNLNLLLKFDKRVFKHYYIINNFLKFKKNYFSVIGNNTFLNDFFFFKNLRKNFYFTKNFYIDAVLSKKKNSTFKKRDYLKKLLFFKVRKLLSFNRRIVKKQKFKVNKKYYNNLNNINLFFKKKKRIKNINFFKKNKYRKLKNIQIRRGFFKILLQNRKLLRSYFFLKTAKQKRINKFLSKKNYIPSKKFYLNEEYDIKNILIRSQFFFFKSDVLFFLQNGYVYLNGSQLKNTNFKCKLGDRIQLLFSQNYFFFFRTKTFFSKFFFRKVVRKMNKMYKRNIDFYKMRSYYFPNWIFKMIYFYNDIPKYLEVDFTIMTSIIFIQPQSFRDFNILNWIVVSSYLYRLYNWKRII